MSNTTPVRTVSVILRTKNEEAGVGRCLESLIGQVTEYGTEIILVDSGSTDRTLEIARSFPVEIHRIRPEDFSFGHSLNVGIDKAGGEAVAVISAHSCPADEHWIQRLVQPLEQPLVVASFGRDLNDPLKKCPFDAFLKSFQGEQRTSYRGNAPLSNTNSAFLREVALQYPFDEQVPASEDKLWARMVQEAVAGSLIVYEPAARVYHTDRLSLSEIYRKRRISGEALDLPRDIPVSLVRATAGFLGGLKDNYGYLRRHQGYGVNAWLMLPFYHLVKSAGFYAGCRTALRRHGVKPPRDSEA